MGELHYGDIFLGAAVALLGWLIRGKFMDYDKKHLQHAEDERILVTDMARIQQEVKDHNKHDAEYFDRIEAMFKEIREALRERKS